MKKFAIAGWASCLASFIVALVLSSSACHSRCAPAHEPQLVAHDSAIDGGIVIGSNGSDATKLVTPTIFQRVPNISAHRLGAALDGGPLLPLTWQLTAPITPPFGDAQISAIEVRSISLDLTSNVSANGALTATVGIAGDGPPAKSRTVIIALTPTQQANFQAALKVATATQLGVTFQ